MPNRPIGIFDSGVGGISVLKEIHKQLPHEDLIYIADSAHAPYGDKDSQYIIQRCGVLTRFLLTKDIKALVIACNTATAMAAKQLRVAFPQINIVAMEPAIKPAVALTKTGVIGVMATQQTIVSQRLADLADKYGKGIRIESQICHGLVEQVESGQFSSLKTQGLLAGYIEPLLDKGVDTLILGCTHYPFLIDSIKLLTQGTVNILETSVPVTQQLIRKIKPNLLHGDNKAGHVCFYSSQNNQQVIKRLWQKPLKFKVLPKQYC